MKTPLSHGNQEELRKRVRALRPDSQRHWGKMSAHETICHVADAFRMYMGLKAATGQPSLVSRTVIKWTALWAPARWPHGFRMLPELDQMARGTPPLEFERDVEELLELMHRMSSLQPDFVWPVHPLFGRLSEREWMRLGYLHTDHHLRQFGC